MRTSNRFGASADERAPAKKRGLCNVITSAARSHNHQVGRVPPLAPWAARLVLSLLALVMLLSAALPAGAGDVTEAAMQPFRQVYVPVDDLNVLFNQQRGVLLERKEFDELWEKAAAAQRQQGDLLDDVVLSNALYSASVHNNMLQIDAQWTISKQVTGWRQVPLSLQGVAISTASLDDEPARLGLNDSGVPTLFVVETGEHTLKLTLATMLDEAKGSKVARFHLPATPGSLTVKPPANFVVEVGGRKVEKQADSYVVAMGGRGDVQLALVPELDSGERPPVLFSNANLVAQVSPAQTEWTASFRLQTFAQPIDRLTLGLPSDLEVISVTSSGLASWEVEPGMDKSILTVRYAAEWKGNRELTIRAGGPSAVQDSWRLPHWNVNQAAYQTGTVTLHISDPLAARIVSSSQARRLPVTANNQAEIQLSYWSPSYDVVLAVVTKARKLAVGAVTNLNVLPSNLELISSVTVEPRDGSLFDTELLMNSGWHIRSVQVDQSQAPFRAVEDNGTLRLFVELPRPVNSGESVALTIYGDRVPPQWLSTPGEPSTVDLTTVRVAEADETEGVVLIRAPDMIQVQAISTAGLESVPTAGIAGADEQVRLALRYRDGQASGNLLARRKPAHISVETHAVAVLRENHLQVRYDVDYSVSGGATDRLTFELPQSEGQSVTVSSSSPNNPISYQADRAIEGNKRRWTLRFSQEITDSVQIAVLVEQPREGDRGTLPVLTVEEAVRQSGTVAVEGGLAQQVSVEQEGLRPIDPSELPTRETEVGDDRLVASFQYRRLPYSLTLAVEKYPTEEVLTAFCSQAQLESVLDPSGHARHRANFTIINQGLQKLALTLPENSKLLSAKIGDEPVEVHRQDQQYLLPMPPGVADSLQVEIFYQTFVKSLSLLSDLALQAPQLNLPILEITWTVHVPDGMVVVGTEGPLTPSSPLTRSTLLGALRETLWRPGGQRIFNPLELFEITQPAREFRSASSSTFDMAMPQAIESAPPPMAPTPSDKPISEPQPPGVAEADESTPQSGQAQDQLGTLRMRRQGQSQQADKDYFALEPTAEALQQQMLRNAPQPGGEPREQHEFRFRNELVERMDAGGIGGAALGLPNWAKSKGLLSLSLSLDPVGTRYEFRGLRSDFPLQILVQDRAFSQSITVLVALGVVLFGWVMRRRSRPARAMFVALALSLAIGLSGLVPLGAVYVLDGLFVGALLLWLLYILRAVGMGIASVTRHRAAVVHATACLLGMLCLVTTVSATEPHPKEFRPTLYVPYAVNSDPLTSTSVYLPQREYDRLRALAFPNELIHSDPVATGVVSAMKLTGKIEGESAQFQGEITLWSFRDDWVELAVPLSGVIFSDVLLDDVPATIASPGKLPTPAAESQAMKANSQGPAFPVVYVRGRGQHTLSVRFAAPARRDGVTGQVQLQLGQFVAASIQLELPEENMELTAQGLTAGWHLNGQTVTAALSPSTRLQIEWAPPDTRRSGDVLANVHQTSRVAVAAEGIYWQSHLVYRIVQGAVDRWEIAVPPTALVREVRGAGVADWWLKGTGDARTLVVTTGNPWTSASELDVELFLPTPQEDEGPKTVRHGSLACAGIARETGELLLTADPTLQVNVRSTTAMQEVDPAGVQAPPPAEKEHASLRPIAAYRFVTRPRELVLAVEPIAGRLASTVQSAIIVRPERTELQTNVSLSQRGLPLVATQLLLPSDFAIEAVESDHAMQWSQFPTPDHVVVEVEWLGARAVTKDGRDHATVHVHGWVTREAATQLTVPSVEVRGAETQGGNWAVFLTPGLDAQAVSSTGLRSIRPADLPQPLRQMPLEYTTVDARLAYQQQAWPAQLQLQLTTLQPRVTATSVSVVSVRELAVANIVRLVWHIEQAGVRTLQFSCPAELGEDLTISGPGVRQIESEVVDENRRRFRVSLDRPYLGEYQLQIVHTQPLPDDGVIATPSFLIEQVESSQRYVVLENLSPDQLDRVPNPNVTFELIEIDAIPIALAEPLKKRVIEVLRLSDAVATPVWRLQSSEQVNTAPASVNLVDLLMVVDETGDYRAQGSYRVSNRQEQFLALQLPAGAKVWSLYVAGKPSVPSIGTRDGKPVLLAPLPRTAAGDFSSLVELVYTGRLDQQGGWLQSWTFPSPKVVGLPVAHTQWTLYLPDRFNYTMVQGNMEEVEQAFLDLSRQSATFQEAFDLISQANYGKGSARYRARTNLLNLDFEVRSDAAVKTEKSQQLLQKNFATAQQLRDAVKQLREQPVPTTTAARQVQLNQYFAPLPEPSPTPSSDRRSLRELERKSKAEGGETARARLKERVELQTELLNRAVQEKAPLQQQVQQPIAAPKIAAPQPVRPVVPNVSDLSREEVEVQLFSDGVVPYPKREGGLSVRIQLPKVGEPLYFAKARGDAALSMQAYPAKTNQQAMAWIWCAVVVCLSLSVAWWIGSPSGWHKLARHWLGLLLAVSLLWWLALPGSFLGFALFCVTLFLFGIRFLFRAFAPE